MSTTIDSNRYKNEHWAVPSNPSHSFFGDKKITNQLLLLQQQKQQNPKIFSLAFPPVYNLLSFLEARDIMISFYPTCTGFAEIVQSLSFTWWYDRLFDSLFPPKLRPLHLNHNNSISFHEKRQDQLRQNALHELHRLADERQLQQQERGSSSDTRKRLIQACHFFQQKIAGCSGCHFPTIKNFVAKNPRYQLVEGEELHNKFVSVWNSKQAQVEAFFLRGDSAERREKNDGEVQNSYKVQTNILEGLAVPFCWQHLVDDDEKRHKDDKMTQSQNGNNTSAEFMNTCRVCHQQYQIPTSNFHEADPVEFILGPIRKMQQDQQQEQVDSSNNTSDTQQLPTPKYPPQKIHPKFRNEETLEILKANVDQTLLSNINIIHETEYWALLSGSVATKVLTYVFHGERKHAVFSRLTNPITLKSVELRSFFSYRSDAFPRFFCQITLFMAESDEKKRKEEEEKKKQQKDEEERLRKEEEEEAARSKQNGNDETSDDSDLSSLSSSDSDDESSNANGTAVPALNPVSLKKKKKKKKKNEILLTGTYATPQKRRYGPPPGAPVVPTNTDTSSSSSSDFKDRMEELFNKDSEQVKELFFAGYGRVEVEIAPKIHAKQLQNMADYLGLSPGFPLALLWNAALYSTGFVVDYLLYADDMRSTHKYALENIFDESLKD